MDGDAIRGEPSLGADIDFTNWGEGRRFPTFIPLYDIWIDQAALDAAPEDEGIFIDAAVYEWRLLAAGAKYEDSWRRVEAYETKERRKAEEPLVGKSDTDPHTLPDLYLGTLGVEDDGTVVKLVHAKTVQDTYDDDFTEGGHWRVYKWIPRGEIWIGDDIGIEERPYLVIHETDEMHYMAHWMAYDAAHKRASELEWHCRHHPGEVVKTLALLGFRQRLPGETRKDAALSRHIFRMMLRQRRLSMGKGNRAQTRHLRPAPWLYPHAVERSYALQIRKWLLPLQRQAVAHLKAHYEDFARADTADAKFPDDPTQFSPGPGSLSARSVHRPGPLTGSMLPAPAVDPNRGHARPEDVPEFPHVRTRTVREFLDDLHGQAHKEPWGTPVLPIATAQSPVGRPPQEKGVEHYDKIPGTQVTTFLRTTAGWVAQQWPADVEHAPAEIMMGLGDTAADILKANAQQWKKQTTSVLGLSFENSVGDWWPDLRDRWADRNYDLIKNLARDYIGRINDLTERAVTNGWGLRDLTDQIQGIGAGISDRRARVIARDQVGKLNGQLTQAQQTEAGIEMYLWDTAGDERVRGRPGGKYPDAMPSHWIMQGKLCRWDDAGVYSEDGGKTWIPRTSDMPDGHPGDDIQCRCTAIPYFADLVGIIDQGIDGEREAPPPPRRTSSKPEGGLPTRIVGSLRYLAEVAGWTPKFGKKYQKAAVEVTRLADSYVREFPVMKSAVKYIGEADSVARAGGLRLPAYYKTPHVWAWHALVSGRTSYVGINFKHLGMPQEWKARLEDTVARKFHPEGTATFKATVDHELGHVIAAMTGAERDQQLMELYDHLEVSEITEGLGEYGASNISEFIAEGWSEYRNNPRAREISRKIGDRLTELLRMKENRP